MQEEETENNTNNKLERFIVIMIFIITVGIPLLINLNYFFASRSSPKETTLCRPISLSGNKDNYQIDAMALTLNAIREFDKLKRKELYKGCDDLQPIKFLPNTSCPNLNDGKNRKCPSNPIRLKYKNLDIESSQISKWINWAYGGKALAWYINNSESWPNFSKSFKYYETIDYNKIIRPVNEPNEMVKLIENKYDVIVFDIPGQYQDHNAPHLVWHSLYEGYPITPTGNYDEYKDNAGNRIPSPSETLSSCLLFEELYDGTLQDTISIPNYRFQKIYLTDRTIQKDGISKNENLHELSYKSIKDTSETLNSIDSKYSVLHCSEINVPFFDFTHRHTARILYFYTNNSAPHINGFYVK